MEGLEKIDKREKGIIENRREELDYERARVGKGRELYVNGCFCKPNHT